MTGISPVYLAAMSVTLPISASTRRMASATATAGQTAFPYTFPLLRANDIRVRRTRAGVTVTLSQSTDYTVSGVGNAAGGTVTLVAGSLAGDIIDIDGLAGLDRVTGVTSAGRFSSAQIDRDLDLTAIRDQELRRDIDQVVYQTANIPELRENIQDIVGAMMRAGVNAFVTYDDVNNTISISAGNSNSISPKTYGAIGDGTTDDTVALQTAINAAAVLNLPVILDGHYLVKNLTIPASDIYSSDMPFWKFTTRLIGVPGTVIERISGGNTAYMMASQRWAENIPYGSSPVWVQNIRFDGGFLCDNVFVNVGYASVFTDCIFERGNGDGFLEPATTLNGTTISGSRALNRYTGNKFRNNKGIGFAVAGAIGANYNTDCWFENNELYDNNRNASFGQAAGWKIIGNHAWNYAVAPGVSENWSVYLQNGNVATLSNNIWEGYAQQTSGLLVNCDGLPPRIIGDNFLNGLGLEVSFSAASTLLVQGCAFFGPFATLRHGTSGNGRDILSINNAFNASPPYVFLGGAGHLGRIISRDDVVQGNTRILTGMQRHNVLAAQTVEGISYWTADADFQCTDAICTVIRVGVAPTGTRNFTLDQNPSFGMRRTLVRSASGSGSNTINVYAFGSGSILAAVGPGSSWTFQYDGAGWFIEAQGAA